MRFPDKTKRSPTRGERRAYWAGILTASLSIIVGGVLTYIAYTLSQ